MAVPKRKHSTYRKGKRLKAKTVKFNDLVICKNCHKLKMPHRICKYCKKN